MDVQKFPPLASSINRTQILQIITVSGANILTMSFICTLYWGFKLTIWKPILLDIDTHYNIHYGLDFTVFPPKR